MLKYLSLRLSLLVLGLVVANTAWAQAPLNVVVTLKPVYGLVASIMGDTGAPKLLLTGKYSPHQTSLAPSMIRRTENADMLFWIGPSLEPYMDRLQKSLKAGKRAVALDRAPALTFLPAREGGNWQAREGEISDHDHDASDPHFWLSVENAMRMADFIASSLSRINPKAAAIYSANNIRLKQKLAETRARINRQLAPVRKVAFFVFHDAYQYFERDYGLNVLGSVTVDPDRQPGAKRIRKIREKISTADARCLFREPQFPSRFIDTITDGLDVRIGVLDPVGADLAPGPDIYTDILKSMADAVSACLSR